MTQFYFLKRKEMKQQREKNEVREEEEKRGASAGMRIESNEGSFLCTILHLLAYMKLSPL